MDCTEQEYLDVDILNNKIVHVDFSDSLTPAHKIVLLKYMQLNTDFMQNPENYPKIRDQVCTELNKLNSHCTSTDWIGLMKNWVEFVKEKYMEIKKSRKNFSFGVEDFELLNMIDQDKLLMEPTTAELSCILDHLEIAHTSPKVWLTITLELEALGSQSYKEEQWKKIFERWSNKVKRKKQILDDLEMDSVEKASFLNPLEQRLLEFQETVNSLAGRKEDLVCRVCLESKSENVKEINELSSEGLSISQMIGECANVEVQQDDGLPQHICEICLNLLEEAYKFKSLCETSDYQLRNMSKTVGTKEEYVEYIIGDITEIDSENMDTLDEIQGEAVEISLEFKEDDKKSDSDSPIDKELENSLEEEPIEESQEAQELKESATAADTSIHQCEVCGIICYNKVSLKKHMHSHTIERPHPCSICSKEFKTKLTLRVHMRSHTGERPYVCEVCGKAFTQDCTLSYHRSIHTGEKKYMCNMCDYRARNVNDLKIHMRTHTGARPYQCTECPSKFTTSSNLQKHLRRHTGVKNFQTCGKAFKTWSAVTNHRAIHSEVKMFQCQHCSYRGSTKANLQIHNRTHTRIQPYACQQCPLKFSTASNRNKHIRNVHEKLKLHKCGSCGRSFFSRESARKHMVIHTGLKPYTCTECPMAYGWYNGLQKHMRTQHPGVSMPTEKHFLDIMDK